MSRSLFSVLPVAAAFLGSVLLTGCASTQSRTHDSAGHHASPASAPTPTASTPSSGLAENEPIQASAATVLVSGLSCPKCATNVELAFKDLPGVRDVQLDLLTGDVQLALKDPKPTPSDLRRAVERAGFTVRDVVVR